MSDGKYMAETTTSMDWKARVSSVSFWIGILLAIATPVLGYYGLVYSDLTTWGGLWDLIVKSFSNPYVVGMMAVGVWNAINKPTTSGLGD